MKNICRACPFVLIALIVFSCYQTGKETSAVNESVKSPSVRDSVFFSPLGGDGYDIIVDGKVIIHQPNIPVIARQLGFVSVEDARRTAQMVIFKMKKNQFPPHLTKIELKELGIVR